MNQSSTKKREKWESLYQQYMQSGKTLQSFCDKHRLKKHTFQYWRSKFRKEGNSIQGFHQIKLTTTAEQETTLKLYFPNGSYLEIPAGYPPAQLASLLQSMR